MKKGESGLAKAKIKKPKTEWQRYLGDKELLVGKLGDNYNLIGFKGEYKELCKIAWENEPQEEHEYDTLESFITEFESGNNGFGFEADELEILEEL